MLVLSRYVLVPFRAVTRHHGEFSIMGTPSLQPFLKSYWLTPVQITGQLSQSMQIWRARDSINAMLVTITSQSSTSPVEFVMATVCKICAGPIEPLDHHLHYVACLGLAHAAESPTADIARTYRPTCSGPAAIWFAAYSGGAHWRQRCRWWSPPLLAAGAPSLPRRRTQRLPIPRFFFPRTLSAPPSNIEEFSHPLARRRDWWRHVLLGLGEEDWVGIGARSFRQLGAFRPPRGAHEGDSWYFRSTRKADSRASVPFFHDVTRAAGEDVICAPIGERPL